MKVYILVYSLSEFRFFKKKAALKRQPFKIIG